MIACKARFIEQAFTGDDSVRTIEDVSEASQYAMALAMSGPFSSRVYRRTWSGCWGQCCRGSQRQPVLQPELNNMAKRLNHRPRKGLDFATPAEVFQQDIMNLKCSVALQT